MTSSTISPLVTPDTRVILVPRRPRTRVWELDFLRGVSVLLMILDHLVMLLVTVFGPAWFGSSLSADAPGAGFVRWCEWFLDDSTARKVLHPLVVFVFFSISGISCTFSRSNFKRGGILAALAIVYSLVTHVLAETLAMPDIIVNFGVLHFYAVAILTYAVIDALTKRSEALRTAVCAAVALTVGLLYFLYQPPADAPTWLGIIFPPHDIHGVPNDFIAGWEISPGDLFTVIPNLASFMFGATVAPLLYASRRSLLPVLDGKWNLPVNFVGKHSLWFFILHLPVLAVILALVSVLFMTPGDWVLF